MNTFKLLFLPFLAFQRVIRVMDLIDVFELSQTSKRMFAKIKLAKRKIFPARLEIQSEIRRIRICDYLDREGEGKNFKLNFTFDLKLSNVKWELKGYNIGICEKIEKDELYPGFIGPFQDNFIDLIGKLYAAFNLPMFTEPRAWWVRIEHLLNMKCDFCILERHELTINDMKRIVKHWLEGNLSPTFYRLGISKFEIEPDWKDFLKDVKYKKWDEKRRARYFITYFDYSVWQRDCKDGWDFEREDGKLATVFQDEDHFEFIVWHDRFPVLP